ncbi:MFS transporter [Streptacidiphilus sp. N1-12]|uniref:MFS transporter n=2 Tax=Streptacidiphilus alkalitolerans TaxID=3342712 RepID=A0ABV6WPM7_9ACTN
MTPARTSATRPQPPDSPDATGSGRGEGGERPAGRRRALFGISLGYFMVLLDTTVLAVAEPDLARSLGTSTAGLQWAFTGYTVALGALLLSGGAVSDRYGAHRAFRYGIAVFGLGSLLSALAPNLWTLVLLRVLLGAAAAAAVPATLSLITRLYPDPVERARAVAVWAATSGSALAAGPLVGGFLVDLAGWRAVFLVNVPLAALTLACTLGRPGRTLRSPRGPRAVDWSAQLAACAALGLLTDLLIALGSGGYVHAGWSAAGTVAAAAVFVRLERRSAAPVLPPSVLRAPGMPALLLTGAAVTFAMMALVFVLPLVLQQSMRLTPFATGAAFLPMTLPCAFNPLLTGRIVARVGPWRPVLGGLGLLALGSAVIGAAMLAGDSYPLLAVGLVCCGFGVSFSLPALVTALVATAPAGTAGAASGLLNAARQTGGTIGVAAVGAFALVGRSGGGTALAWAQLLPSAVCLVPAVMILRGRGKPAGSSTVAR